MEKINSLKTNNTYSNFTDEELVAEIVLTKNTGLFSVLYDRYSKTVYNKCLSFVKDDNEAQDLTQDIFLKLFIKLPTFNGKSKFFTWLYSFTYNFCVNYVTRDVHKKIEKQSISIDERDNLLIEIDDYSLFQLRVDNLQKALEMIAPEDKMLLLLKYQDAISIKELSKVLDIGESAVKMRLKRAKARIIKKYNEIL